MAAHGLNEVPPPIDPPIAPADDPYFTYPSEGTSYLLTSSLLVGVSNYIPWTIAVKEALQVRNKLCFIDGSTSYDSVPMAQRRRWDNVNTLVKTWIRNSVDKSISGGLIYSPTARSLWLDLKEMYGKIDGTHVFQLTRQIYNTPQGTLSITEYFQKMKQLWDALASIDDIFMACDQDRVTLTASKEEQKLVAFLIGVNDTYDNVRSNLLMRHPLPSLSTAFATLLQEENQRSARGCISDGLTDNTTALYSGNGNKNFKRTAAGSSGNRPRIDRSNWLCSYCGRKGHRIDICWVKNGVPEHIKRKRALANGVTEEEYDAFLAEEAEQEEEETEAVTAATVHVAAPSRRIVHVAAPSKRIVHVAAASPRRVVHKAAPNTKRIFHGTADKKVLHSVASDPLHFDGNYEAADDTDTVQAHMAGPLRWADYEDWY